MIAILHGKNRPGSSAMASFAPQSRLSLGGFLAIAVWDLNFYSGSSRVTSLAVSRNFGEFVMAQGFVESMSEEIRHLEGKLTAI